MIELSDTQIRVVLESLESAIEATSEFIDNAEGDELDEHRSYLATLRGAYDAIAGE